MKNIENLDLKNKRVLIRCDFNVPLEGEKITDDLRIVSSLETINLVLDKGGAVILMSHLGRPKGEPKKEFSLRPVAKRLSELINKEVIFIPSDRVVDEEVSQRARALQSGEIMLLENLRFRKEEEKNEEGYAKELSSLADVYINDAFGTSHRAHASNVGVAKFLPSYMGKLVEREVRIMGNALKNPKRPFVVILGGAKIKDKISVIKNLIDKVDSLLIGGGMANTFLKAKGYNIGNSLVDDENLDFAKEMIEKARERGVDLRLPVDVVIANSISDDDFKTIDLKDMPNEQMILDIGDETVDIYSKIIKDSKTVVWNGPMGVFENQNFSKGTFEIARALSESECVSIIGGGDSASAVMQSGYKDKITHISTGGGASLEFLEGKALPGIVAIGDGNV